MSIASRREARRDSEGWAKDEVKRNAGREKRQRGTWVPRKINVSTVLKRNRHIGIGKNRTSAG